MKLQVFNAPPDDANCVVETVTSSKNQMRYDRK